MLPRPGLNWRVLWFSEYPYLALDLIYLGKLGISEAANDPSFHNRISATFVSSPFYLFTRLSTKQTVHRPESQDTLHIGIEKSRNKGSTAAGLLQTSEVSISKHYQIIH